MRTTSRTAGLRARLARGTMTRPTQGLLMAFLGAVLVRLSLSDDYLRYVTEWMKWPILASGVLLVGLAVGLVVSERVDHGPDHGHGHGPVPLVTWLLVLPGLVTFVVSPPQLGSYLAERRSGEAQAVAEPAALTDLGRDGGQVVPVELTEFVWRAQEGGETLVDRTVELTGFVSYDQEQNWYVTRMTIGCCAADAIAYQVRVAGDAAAAERPPRDQWVSVTGVHEAGSGAGGTAPPVIDAADVARIETPAQTYE